MTQCYPDMPIINVSNNKTFTLALDIPTNLTQFENLFTVCPHLGRMGGGKVHIHFRLPVNITIEELKQNPPFLMYLKHHRIWSANHHFTDLSIVTVRYIFMKSPSITHLVDYVKTLKMYIFRNGTIPEELLRNQDPSTKIDSDTNLSQSGSTPWTSVHDIPHMELNRRNLTIKNPNATPDDKPAQVTVLELKSSPKHVQVLREAILSAKISERWHGIFIPPNFIKESPSVVYTTALRHIQFLQQLRVIPVSGLHSSTFSMPISDPDDPNKTFFDLIYTTKATSVDKSKPSSYLFSSVEASQLTQRNGKWYFLTNDANFNSANIFIDHQLVDIYQQSGFHRLPQTQKSPFHRGPHRLTKMSEAATHHFNKLQQQETPTVTSQPKIQRRPLPQITYATTQFPSLPKITRAPGPSSSQTANPHTKTSSTPTIDPTYKTRLDVLENKVQHQQDQLEKIQQQLNEQQEAIQRITKIVEDQQKLTATLQESISQLTTTVTNMEKIMTQILQFHRKDPPTPDQEQPIKRSRYHQETPSPDHGQPEIMDQEMHHQETWESPPNMPSDHSPKTAKSP